MVFQTGAWAINVIDNKFEILLLLKAIRDFDFRHKVRVVAVRNALCSVVLHPSFFGKWLDESHTKGI